MSMNNEFELDRAAMDASPDSTLDDFSLHTKPLALVPAFLYNYFRYPRSLRLVGTSATSDSELRS
jgi:hypothetical protein